MTSSGKDQAYYRKHWIKAEKEKPKVKFDLCLLKDAKGRVQSGWWDGHKWVYGAQKYIGDVVWWKREREEI